MSLSAEVTLPEMLHSQNIFHVIGVRGGKKTFAIPLKRHVMHDIISSMPTPRRYASRAEQQRAYRERQAEARQAERAAKGLPAAPAIPTIPGKARWEALIASALSALDASRDEMQVYFDERSESWQESERGEELRERIENLERIIESFEELD